MGEAFKRLAQEYPWRRDGLSLSERRLLAGTPGTKYELFERGGARRSARSWATRSRSTGSTGSRRCCGPRAASCTSTTAGERVLAGEAEFVTERWIGGVHVTPRDAVALGRRA